MSVRKPYRRRRTVVLPREQWGFALRILGLQLLSLLVYLAALQLRIVEALRATDSIEVELALREVFQMGLMTLVVIGPVLAILVALTALQLSNRVFGPVLRLRRALRALAEGDRGLRIRFRPGDVLRGVDEDFNTLAEALERQEEAAPEPPSEAAVA